MPWSSQQPDVWFERTDEGAFKTSPEKVREKGPLSAAWITKEVARIEVAKKGLYVWYDARKSPHWMEQISKRKAVAALAKKRGAKVRVLGVKDGPHLHPGHVIATNNHDELFESIIQKYLLLLDFQSLSDDMIPVLQKGVCERNNAARSAGFADRNIKAKGSDEVTKPQAIAGTTKKDVQRMCIMTECVYAMFDELHERDPQIQLPTIMGDTRRINDFALKLCRDHGIPEYLSDGRPSNIFEFSTFAVTVCNQGEGVDLPPTTKGVSTKPTLFTCHVDGKNCPINKEVIIMYEHVFNQDLQLWLRVVHIATWRKSVTDYYRRLTGARFYKAQITAYKDHAVERHAPTLDDCHHPDFKDKPDEPRLVLPCFDKVMGYTSSITSVISKLLDKYRLWNDIKTLIFLLVPLGWSCGPVLICEEYGGWLKRGVPFNREGTFGCLTIAYINACVERHGGVNRGSGHRSQNSLNCSFTVEEVFKQADDLLQAFIRIHRDEGTMPYRRAWKSISDIYQFTGLGAQHILYVLSCLGFIGERFAAESCLCPGTETHKRLVALGIPRASANKVYSDLAKDWGKPESFVESTGCEYLRDCDGDEDFNPESYQARLELRIAQKPGYKLAPDCFVYGQYLYEVRRQMVRRQMGTWEIMRHERVFDSSGGYRDEQEPVVRRSLPSLEAYVKQSLRSDDIPQSALCQEVKTSENSLLPSATKEERDARDKQFGKKNRKRKAPKDPKEKVPRRKKQKVTVGRKEKVTARTITDNTYNSPVSFGMQEGLFSERRAAMRQNGTFRYVDVLDLAVQIVAMPKELKQKKRRRSFFAVEEVMLNGITTYTCSLRTGGGVVKTSGESKALLRHHFVDVSHDGRACYTDEASAIKACIIQALCEHPYRRAGKVEGGVPNWVDRYLPLSRRHCPSQDFCELYVNGRKGHEGREVCPRLFGVLSFHGDERILGIPKDASCSREEWQFFHFAAINSRIS
jgi:hypothetical protein